MWSHPRQNTFLTSQHSASPLAQTKLQAVTGWQVICRVPGYEQPASENSLEQSAQPGLQTSGLDPLLQR